MRLLLTALFLFLIVFFSSELEIQSIASAQSDPETYEIGTDPALGYSMNSYIRSRFGMREWTTGVSDMKTAKCRHVSIVAFRSVDAVSGRVNLGTGPSMEQLNASIVRAKVHGMKVTLTPLFDVLSESGATGWRGNWNPKGKQRTTFYQGYQRFILALARLAERHNVERFNIASELDAMVEDDENDAYFNRLINRTQTMYSGNIGYAATYDSYQSERVKELFWDNDSITDIRLSLYPHNFVSLEDSDASDLPEFQVAVADKWNTVINEELIPYAAAQKDGAGMPIVIQEVGAVPYNRAATYPWSFGPGVFSGQDEEIEDQNEQEIYIMEFIKAIDGKIAEIPEVYFWNWNFVGSEFDRYAMSPWVDSPSTATAEAIFEFMNSAEE